MKITTFPIIVMFIASALILPVGISYATYAPGFTTGTPTAQPMTNQTNTNQTTIMSSSTNQTSANPATNKTMTMPPATNQTSSNPAMNKTMTQTNSTVTPPVVAKSAMLSPLQQVKSGVAPKDVQCKAGLTLIFKAEDGSPACVNPAVATILAQRGW